MEGMTPPASAPDATHSNTSPSAQPALRPVVVAAAMPALWAASFALVVTCGFALEHLHVFGGLLVTEFLLILVPALLASRFLLKHDVRQLFSLGTLQLRHVPALVAAALGVWLFAVMVGVVWGILLHAAGMPVATKKISSLLLGDGSLGACALALVVTAIVAPLCEEVLFRGVIQNGLGRAMKPVWAIAATALMFGALHFDPIRILPCAINGAAIGYAAYRYRSIWAGVIMHASGNALALSIAILQQTFATRLLHG